MPARRTSRSVQRRLQPRCHGSGRRIALTLINKGTYLHIALGAAPAAETDEPAVRRVRVSDAEDVADFLKEMVRRGWRGRSAAARDAPASARVQEARVRRTDLDWTFDRSRRRAWRGSTPRL